MMPHPMSDAVFNAAVRSQALNNPALTEVISKAAEELDRLHAIKAAWLFCEANGIFPMPSSFMANGQWVRQWHLVRSANVFHDTPLAAVQIVMEVAGG